MNNNNDNFLDLTGLGYYHGRLETIFPSKTEFDALDDKVDGIIAEGGEPNVIETVKVNGTALTPTNKAVDVIVPTKTSDFTNDGDGTSNFATESYVDENGGKIDKIKVNGTEQTITNKEVDLSIPTAESNKNHNFIIDDNKTTNEHATLTFNSTGADRGVFVEVQKGDPTGTITRPISAELANTSYVDSKGSIAIDSSNNNKTTFKVGSKTSSLATSPDGVIYTEGASDVLLPSKSYVDDAIAGVTGMEFVQVDTLPAEGEKGKIYLVPNNTAGDNIKDEYIWIQDGPNGRFEKIGSTDVDLSNYWNNTNLVAITTAEIDTLFA